MKVRVAVSTVCITLVFVIILILFVWKPNRTGSLQSLLQSRKPVVVNESVERTWTRLFLSAESDEMPFEANQKQGRVRFLYMIQTESCLDDYLQEVIGNPSACSCDVLVLSFKRECEKLPSSNVKYIYTGQRTSWGGGRNVLYEAAMKKEQVYLYFLLLDDDIVLKRQSEDDPKGKPWRMFEEFLVRVEPANAAIDIVDNLWLRRAAIAREHMNCVDRINASAEEYLSVARYDAAFNAFHNKTIRHILPYLTSFDQVSWIFAPMYINVRIELMYAGHSVLHNQIFGDNPKHRPYRRVYPSSAQFHRIVDEAIKDMPEKYRNSSLERGWRASGLGHEQWSPTVCIPPPPPKMPIRPYAYLDGILSTCMNLNC